MLKNVPTSCTNTQHDVTALEVDRIALYKN